MAEFREKLVKICAAKKHLSIRQVLAVLQRGHAHLFGKYIVEGTNTLKTAFQGNLGELLVGGTDQLCGGAAADTV